jgi:hypothetical protein
MSADGADGEGGPKQRFELYIKVSKAVNFVMLILDRIAEHSQGMAARVTHLSGEPNPQSRL